MIGLEYILQLYNISFTELSKELNITRANFYNWTTGKRKIPGKYIELLSERFKIPQKFFQKNLTELDKLKIQNVKLHNEACEQMDKEVDGDGEFSEHDKMQFDVEIQLEKLQLNEAMEDIKNNLENIGNREFLELEDITYSLKTFFDVYNFKESRLIGFSNILHLIANYLNIEGYRDEDADDIGYIKLPNEFERVADEKREIFKKKLFELLDYRKNVEEEYERGKNEFMKKIYKED